MMLKLRRNGNHLTSLCILKVIIVFSGIVFKTEN